MRYALFLKTNLTVAIIVTPDRVDVAGNRYSVPDRYCGEHVVCHPSLAGLLTVYGRGSAAPVEPIAH